MAAIPLAVIGGSGFYDMPGLESIEERTFATPFGSPSDAIRIGLLDGVRVAFLARHGRHHHLLPSELPQRANFWALKSLGVERVVSVSAVGSLREDFAPGHLVVPDQIVDRSAGLRPATFFGDGAVAHVGFGDPYCPALRTAVTAAGAGAGAKIHGSGTYVVIEGPAFGTRAESEVYRQWGCSVVGMTALPEAKLAREAELCYATLAAVTDYDSWRAEAEAVDATAVFAVMKQNVRMGQATVRAMVRSLSAIPPCTCATALDSALVTNPTSIPQETKQRLLPLLARRLEASK